VSRRGVSLASASANAGASGGGVHIPRLHLVTNDTVIAAAGFVDRATAVLDAFGTAVALHLRGHASTGAALYRLAEPLARAAAAAGALMVVNDRLDVALAAGCGVQLGRRSIPAPTARRLLGPGAVVGYSAHEAGEAASMAGTGVDLVVLGTIWPSASHPGEPAAGTSLISAAAAAMAATASTEAVAVPIVAIGGVTPERARAAMTAGAHGVAVLSGVWGAGDAVTAALGYLEAMGVSR
jgi:thiamine-phosphate diphosphorylase